MRIFNIVVEGCVHGKLNQIYDAVSSQNKPVDLVLLCGDFQAIRDHKDLNAMAVPAKYKEMGDFYQYYSGQKVAPYLTIFIGGNHESSSYLRELYYGGWVAPNIYYLGQAGVVNFKGLRIAGLSGIYDKNHYNYNHFERLPYNSGTERSIYHVRSHDVVSLSLLSSGIDVMLSHDWPAGITYYGDMKGLLKKKPYFRKDIENNELGSPPLFQLLKSLQPTNWFSAHLHVRFTATVAHNFKCNDDEIELDFSDLDDEDIESNKSQNNLFENDNIGWKPFEKARADSTFFLALDKCLPRRSYMEFLRMDVEVPSVKRARDENEQQENKNTTTAGLESLCYDPEWLAIVRVMNKYLNMGPATKTVVPGKDELRSQVDVELQWIKRNIIDKGKLVIPLNFRTLTQFEDSPYQKPNYKQPDPISNNQTEDFCRLLAIENKIIS